MKYWHSISNLLKEYKESLSPLRIWEKYIPKTDKNKFTGKALGFTLTWCFSKITQ